MKNLIKRISVVFLSSIVFFLSIGVSFSNKCCSPNPIKKPLGQANNIYFCKDISQNREEYTKHFEEIKSILLSDLDSSNLDYVVNGNVEQRIPNNLNIAITNFTWML